MHSDVGLSTMGQRLAGLASLHPSARRPQTPPAQGSAAGADFQRLLQSEIAELATAPASSSPSTTQPMSSFVDPSLLPGRPPSLGPGVTLRTGPSLIRPAAPGPAAVGPSSGIPWSGVAPAHGSDDHAGHVHGPPALDRTGPPPELQQYGNGRIPAQALAPIGVGDHSLWEPAARAFRDLLAHAARDGITIGVNDSYRSYERQVEMVERYGLYSQGGRAAAPGSSNHGWGAAVDLQLDDQAQAWMREHARDYGFVEDVPREPWHWTFRASQY